ncbi:MAG: type II secretion system protein [Gemmatimonadota bacterium]|jgi:prepilin-type N-terminal cleavage/methylation domain-containing protein
MTGARMLRRPAAPGFTVTELMVSLMLFGVAMTAALSFLQIESQGFRKGLDYMSSTQTLRQAVGVLEKNLQTAGTNLSVGQPGIVFANEDVLAFNADYATKTPSDPLAVFFDPDLEERAAVAWQKSQKATIPRTSFQYPDITYPGPTGLPGTAETLIFYFEPDLKTPREDDFALLRQVNAEDPKLVARNLLRVKGEPFFRYLTQGTSGLDSVPPSLLPLAHEVSAQGSQADLERPRLVDSIRAVRLTLSATNGGEGEEERISEITRIVLMPNTGFGRRDSCGRKPILGANLSAALQVSGTGEAIVKLRWGRSADEGQGEDDIVRYVLWRRSAGSYDWEDPYLSVPAGQDEYVYEDRDLVMGRTYEYAIAAQDCTPALSSFSVSSFVTVPIR